MSGRSVYSYSLRLGSPGHKDHLSINIALIQVDIKWHLTLSFSLSLCLSLSLSLPPLHAHTLATQSYTIMHACIQIHNTDQNQSSTHACTHALYGQSQTMDGLTNKPIHSVLSLVTVNTSSPVSLSEVEMAAFIFIYLLAIWILWHIHQCCTYKYVFLVHCKSAKLVLLNIE